MAGLRLLYFASVVASIFHVLIHGKSVEATSSSSSFAVSSQDQSYDDIGLIGEFQSNPKMLSSPEDSDVTMDAFENVVEKQRPCNKKVLRIVSVPCDETPAKNSKQRSDDRKSRDISQQRRQQTNNDVPIVVFRRTTFNEGSNDRSLETNQMEEKKRSEKTSSILPPWKEFCRMLGRNGCGRYMR